jgi:hypothetical protein
MKKKEQKQVLSFLKYLKKLEVIETIGVARLLGVQVMNSDNTERNGDEILFDICEAFNKVNSNMRKELLKVLKEAAG